MSVTAPVIEVRTSPHLKDDITTDRIMFNVVVAMMPIVFFAWFAFGLSAMLLIAVTTAATVLTEHAICRVSGKETTIGDYSATITGILLALTLPPGFPLWMGALGGVIAISLGKALFGGLGFNVFNPALVARAFLQAAFPVAITAWTPAFISGRFMSFIPSTLAWPFMHPAPVGDFVKQAAVDGFTGATPLMLMKFNHVITDTSDLFLGMTAGSAGETSSILILLGGAYLISKRMMNWRIPASMLGSVFILSSAFYLYDKEAYPQPLFMLFSGGLMLGAVFMASDMVASPTSPLGVWIYGAFMGALTVIIRLLGGLPEGVMYAILLGNALSPIIEQLTQPRIYGHVPRKKAAP